MLKALPVLITTNGGKFLDMGIPDHTTYLLRNLYVSKKAIVRTRQRQWAGSKMEKKYNKAV